MFSQILTGILQNYFRDDAKTAVFPRNLLVIKVLAIICKTCSKNVLKTGRKKNRAVLQMYFTIDFTIDDEFSHRAVE